jgi:hypothetical protein
MVSKTMFWGLTGGGGGVKGGKERGRGDSHHANDRKEWQSYLASELYISTGSINTGRAVPGGVGGGD